MPHRLSAAALYSLAFAGGLSFLIFEISWFRMLSLVLGAKDVLVVGFGIGVTTSAIASHPAVQKIECVELVPHLVQAAHHYEGLNANVHRSPKLTVLSGDGRHHLASTSRTYDLISSDPTHPILGSGSLYTREYFQLCHARLSPDGMVSQYLPLHKLLERDLLGIIKTFHDVFPGTAVWLGHNHAVLVGAKSTSTSTRSRAGISRRTSPGSTPTAPASTACSPTWPTGR